MFEPALIQEKIARIADGGRICPGDSTHLWGDI